VAVLRAGAPRAIASHVLVHRRKDGKLRQLYVSKAAEAAVRRWVEQDRELRALLEEIWEIHWERAKSGSGGKGQ
jgi:hypothetical protein